jgi:hypothetical protein
MPDKKPRRSGAKLDDCHESLPPPSSPAENHTMAQHRRQAEETPSRAVGFCVGRPTRDRRETPAGRGLGTFFELSAFCAR